MAFRVFKVHFISSMDEVLAFALKIFKLLIKNMLFKRVFYNFAPSKNGGFYKIIMFVSFFN